MGPRGWVLWVGFSGKKKPSNGTYLGGGFKYFLFSPLFGEDSHFDKYFSKGLKSPTSYSFSHNHGSVESMAAIER